MNKKILFGVMAFAALTSCTNDDFESGSNPVAEKSSPIKFEVVNNIAEMTRASMNADGTIKWSATDGDLFTLYHGAAAGAVTGYQNATYTASAGEGAATLTTPSMILPGSAIMVWPVDSTFRIKSSDNLSLKIPAEQTNIENNIPYVSDLVTIANYSADAKYNEAGLNRSYPVYMRPMASQLTVKADYAGTDATLAELVTGDDPIDAIKVTSVDLLTNAAGSTKFTTEIPLKFTEASPEEKTYWTGKVANNAWGHKTEFDVANIADEGKVAKLTAKDDCLLAGNNGAKFLVLPQAVVPATGVDQAGVVVNTIYGKVVVAAPGILGSLYTGEELADAWYRYVKATTAIDPATDNETKATSSTTSADPDINGKYKVTSAPAFGMKQTLNALSAAKAPATSVVKGQDMGGITTRYVKVLLTKLDMSDLHVKSDKQLRDVVRVWKKMGLNPVTVYLDGDDNKEFKISQKTIKVINDINGAYNATTNPEPKFKVQPCNEAAEACKTIVITGASDIQNVQDIPFIAKNGSTKAAVVLNEGETWSWNAAVKVAETGVSKIINKGTMVNAATATLQTKEFNGAKNNVSLQNDNIWNIDGGILNVQFTVNNNGTVNIAKGAQYRQDGFGRNFINNASDIPSRFGGDDSEIGVVNNKGVFATVNEAKIQNRGLIEHADKDAKTYITTNEAGGNFGAAFSNTNKMGRINLPFSNKDEDNISVSAELSQGFISVTVTKEELAKAGVTSTSLDASIVGNKVNYIIVNSGITEISAVSPQVKYLEINQPGTEIVWNVPTTTVYDGLIVLSDVNIKLGTKIIATVTYLGADMYVGGKFNKAAIAAEGTDPDYAATKWTGYYGNTSGNVASKYITY